MKITIAGPGAGKTSNLSKNVLERIPQVQGSKWIFVVTYTNNAVNVIKSKLSNYPDSVINKVSVSTIHSFLLSEIIFPYHHFLYPIKFNRATSIPLPENDKYRAKKCRALHDNGTVHNSEVFKIAKNLIVGKSNDTLKIKSLRNRILGNLRSYISDIFVDEAQDIDEDFSQVLQVFENNGIHITLIGDPKQNIRSCKGFDSLIAKYEPEYLAENHRSPENHVTLLNNFVNVEQQQNCCSHTDGELDLIMGNKVEPNVVLQNPWDLIYIYESSHEFLTKPSINILDDFFESFLEIIRGLHIDEPEKHCFKIVEFVKDKKNFNNYSCITYIEKISARELSMAERAQIHEICNKLKEEKIASQFVVKSIDSIKGCEGERCLFILTSDLVNYLLEPNHESNKASCKLFVALSRSKLNLTIYVHKSVFSKVTETNLLGKLTSYGFIDKTIEYVCN